LLGKRKGEQVQEDALLILKKIAQEQFTVLKRDGNKGRFGGGGGKVGESQVGSGGGSEIDLLVCNMWSVRERRRGQIRKKCAKSPNEGKMRLIGKTW